MDTKPYVKKKPCWGRFDPQSYKCIECDISHACMRVRDQPGRNVAFGRKVAPWRPPVNRF